MGNEQSAADLYGVGDVVPGMTPAVTSGIAIAREVMLMDPSPESMELGAYLISKGNEVDHE